MKRLRYKRARTTEDRIWAFVAQQAEELHSLATSDKPVVYKNQQAETLYQNLKNALRQLGAIR